MPGPTDRPSPAPGVPRRVPGALALLGVRRVSAGYLFLRSGIRENLTQTLGTDGWAEIVLEAYEGGPVLSSGLIVPARFVVGPV